MDLVDVHVHLFPEDVLDAYIEDYTAHSRLPVACRPTVSDLFAEYGGEIDVEKSTFVVLHEWESTKQYESENLQFAAESDSFYTKCYFYYFNEWLGRLQAGHGNVLCFGSLHPSDPGCREEFERMTEDYGLKGLKLVPCMQHFFLNDRRLFPVYEQAEAKGVPMLFHTGGDPVPGMEIFGHPRDVHEIAETFPNLTIILAHMGIPFFEETREILKKHPNVYTDIAFTASFDDVYAFAGRHGIDATLLTRDFWRATVSSLVREFGCERVLYGSDFPFINPKTALREFLELDISDHEKELILSTNAKAVLKI